MSVALATPPPVRTPASAPAVPAPAVPPRLLMTRAEFEAAAEDTATRCEWLGYTDETRDGEPLGLVWPRYGFGSAGNFQMPTSVHSRIVTNLMGACTANLDQDEWQIDTQGMEVGCPTGRGRFPDVLLTHVPAVYAEHPRDRELVLLNPSVCVEVLSDSTANVDLSEKTGDYLSVPTVTDYLVVAQTAREVLHHRRVTGAAPPRWDVTRLSEPGAAVTLASPALPLPLDGLYRRVPGV